METNNINSKNNSKDQTQQEGKKATYDKIVLFELNNELFGMSINLIKGIMKIPEYTHIPQSEDYIEGMINLRGEVIGVVHLGKKIGFSPQQDDHDSRIIIIQMDQHTIGLRVDAVREVITIDRNTMQPAPSLSSSRLHSNFIEGIIVQDNSELLIVVDVERIISSDEAKMLSSAISKTPQPNSADSQPEKAPSQASRKEPEPKKDESVLKDKNTLKDDNDCSSGIRAVPQKPASSNPVSGSQHISDKPSSDAGPSSAPKPPPSKEPHHAPGKKTSDQHPEKQLIDELTKVS